MAKGTPKEIEDHFSNKFTILHALFDADKPDECVKLAHDLLKESDLPRYLRMKTLIILASCIPSIEEANACHSEAEDLWRQERDFQPEGSNQVVDETLKEERDTLNELKGMIEKELAAVVARKKSAKKNAKTSAKHAVKQPEKHDVKHVGKEVEKDVTKEAEKSNAGDLEEAFRLILARHDREIEEFMATIENDKVVGRINKIIAEYRMGKPVQAYHER
jgi:hypothetical protein